jgi:hypothetical protein
VTGGVLSGNEWHFDVIYTRHDVLGDAILTKTLILQVPFFCENKFLNMNKAGLPSME